MLWLAVCLTLLPAAAGPAAGAAGEGPPVAVFAALDGTWQGTFVGYDADGRERYRLTVRQTYRTVDETTQTVTIEDRQADGTVTTGRGWNTAHRQADGSLRLRCVVEKSDGTRVAHEGRLARGPDGAVNLIWWSAEGDRVETFRERVVEENGERVYRIDGMGRYGDTLMLMAGRYLEQR